MGKNFMGYVLIADRKSFSGFYMITRSQLIADDRKRSQKIQHGSIFCDLLRSSAITIAGSQTIADDRRSVFPYDRRRSQNVLRSAIRDPRSSAIIWKPALRVFIPATFRQQMKTKLTLCIDGRWIMLKTKQEKTSPDFNIRCSISQ